MLQIILINYLSCSTYKNTLKQTNETTPTSLTTTNAKKIESAATAKTKEHFFRLNRTYKSMLTSECVWFLLLFSLTKRQMNGIFAPIVHAILYCIELSSNLNLKSNCQYKIRCQSHFYLFFVGVCGVRCAGDEI